MHKRYCANCVDQGSRYCNESCDLNYYDPPCPSTSILPPNYPHIQGLVIHDEYHYFLR